MCRPYAVFSHEAFIKGYMLVFHENLNIFFKDFSFFLEVKCV